MNIRRERMRGTSGNSFCLVSFQFTPRVIVFVSGESCKGIFVCILGRAFALFANSLMFADYNGGIHLSVDASYLCSPNLCLILFYSAIIKQITTFLSVTKPLSSERLSSWHVQFADLQIPDSALISKQNLIVPACSSS